MGTARFYFGHPAAAQDRDLPNYFVETNVFRAVSDLSDLRCIVVGKKGCGKTALFSQIAQVDSDSRVVARVNPDTHQIPEITQKHNYRQYANLFEYELLLEVLKTFIANESVQKSFDRKFLTVARATAGEYLKAIGRKVKDIEEVQILGCGISMTKSSDAIRLASAQKSSALWGLIAQIMAKGLDILILIDDPDQLFGDGEHLRDIVGGLLLSATRITSHKQTKVKTGRIKACTFVKQHKWEALSYTLEDFDHFVQNAIPVSWTEQELDRLIIERIRFREGLGRRHPDTECWARVFDTKNGSLSELRDYLYARLTNGPRDLITFCNLAMDTTSEKERLLEMGSFAAVEGEYSAGCLKEVEREYGDQFPVIAAVVRKIFEHAPLRTEDRLSRNDLTKALSEAYRSDAVRSLRSEAPWLALTSGEQLIETLFKVAIIGFIPRGEPTRRVMAYSSHHIDDSVHDATEFFVHSAYHRALGIS